MTLSITRFPDYFQAIHGNEPYSWQTRLADQAINGIWPDAIDLPTGSGKTACIDAAVFALACQAAREPAERNAPRRVFFCVNRRVIVDEAHHRARRIAGALWRAESDGVSGNPVLLEVAAALRRLSGTAANLESPPLDVLELRGGIYRDNRWARSAAQPTIVCTTVDQLGSRLLFRGYGVLPQAAPIQAALIAYDSLVLLDEAHVSRPFLQSLERVSRYLDPSTWAEEPIGPRPMLVVPMTATPSKQGADAIIIRLDDQDRNQLAARLRASKPAALEPAADVAKAIVDRARQAAGAGGPVAVGIIVNRIATAREVFRKLKDSRPNDPVELVISAMRPIDRDEQVKRLAGLVGPDRPASSERTSFIVSTQCLECGADYDFDVLLTECASLDALRQRFGRLNRAGRPIAASAVIVAKNKDIQADDKLDDDKPLDPIYGNAQARTWNWLWNHADAPTPAEPIPDESRTVDLGIDAFNVLLDEQEGGRIPEHLLGPSALLDSPVMLPAYVDLWCQTSPEPALDPDIALFLHGPQNREPDVQVCWRADLVEDQVMTRDHWCDVVALAPPSSAECLSLPISRLRRWLAGGDLAAKDAAPTDQGDALEVAPAPTTEVKRSKPEKLTLNNDRVGVLWRGARKTALIQSPGDLRPGDTLVLPSGVTGWEQLGHIAPQAKAAETEEGAEPSPTAAAGSASASDVAEKAFEAARGRRVMRLHPALASSLPRTEGMRALLDRLGKQSDAEDAIRGGELEDLLRQAADELPEQDHIRQALEENPRKNSFRHEPYPDGRGFVLTARQRRRQGVEAPTPALDDGDDDVSRLEREGCVSLADHTNHVSDALKRMLKLLPATPPPSALLTAAQRHDWGKADDRFQALLLGAARTDAWLWNGEGAALLAKSDGMPQAPTVRKAARERAGLPAGFRHEMLSVQLAQRAAVPKDLEAERDLILHLIAAHHGHGRPFAPVVLDDDPPDVEVAGIPLTSDERKQRPPHRLDSGIAERFWSLTRRYGWWGLAYLEALLRLADQQASAAENDPQPTAPAEDRI